MSTTASMWLGIAFLFLAIAATILQAWLWSFPMAPDPGGPDPNGKSTAPRLWTRIHRVMGLAYVVIYVVLMWEMVPRLWEYQFELPARTVIHACLGITIGVLLITKISIIRWFQHFGKSLPSIGLSLLICTVILGFLSLPFAIRAHAFTSGVFEPANLDRVERVLTGIDLGERARPADLVTRSSLLHGREVLTKKCAVCHDMRTILIKPRSGSSWHKLVVRMADKPVLGPPISNYDSERVTAYLVAISPDLQNSLKNKRREQRARAKRAAEVAEVKPRSIETPDANEPAVAPFDAEAVRPLYEDQCSQCHELSDVEDIGGQSVEEWTKVVQQMIEEEEAEITEAQAKDIIRYLVHVLPETPGGAAPALEPPPAPAPGDAE